MGEKHNSHGECKKYLKKNLLLNPDGSRQLGRPSSRWEYNIKMGSRELEHKGVDWIDLTDGVRL